MDKDVKKDIGKTRIKIAKEICNNDNDISIEQMYYDLSESSDMSFSEAILFDS